MEIAFVDSLEWWTCGPICVLPRRTLRLSTEDTGSCSDGDKTDPHVLHKRLAETGWPVAVSSNVYGGDQSYWCMRTCVHPSHPRYASRSQGCGETQKRSVSAFRNSTIIARVCINCRVVSYIEYIIFMRANEAGTVPDDELEDS
jgi:hypothetical protein